MSERWHCNYCGLDIERPGPTSLKIAADDHMRAEHPEIVIDVNEWECPHCDQVISRSSATNLLFAKNGHLLYSHRLKPDGTPVIEYSRDRIETSIQPPIGAASGDEPFWPFTDKDRKWMKDMQIKWYNEEHR